MKREIRIALTLSVLLATAAMSAGPTMAADKKAPTYHEANTPGDSGWFVQDADKGRLAVGYTGEKAESRNEVAQFAMLRAAEFTIEQGQEWFAVLSTKTQSVKQAGEDLEGRGGHFMGSGAQQGGDAGIPDARGASQTPSSPFGGAQVPNGVLERWTPTVYQTVLIIQTGSGDKATFEGAVKTPKIFAAKDVVAEIRAKMEPKPKDK